MSEQRLYSDLAMLCGRGITLSTLKDALLYVGMAEWLTESYRTIS